MNKITKKILLEKSYFGGGYCLSPEYLSLIVTFKCNFKCKACSIWEKTDFNELSDEQWLKIASNFKKVFDKETFVEINGGEPLLRKSLVLKLIRELKKYFQTVALNSNGLIINEEIVRELEDVNLDIMKISFYSLNEDTHNLLRCHPQAYEKALNAIRLLSKSKIRLKIGVLITAKNINDLPELISYLSKFDNTDIILQPLDESVESPDSKNKNVNNLLLDIWPVKVDILRFFSWIYKNNEKINNFLDNIKAIEKYYLEPKNVLGYRCFAGQRNFVVYPNGDAALCFKGRIIGNLVRDDIAEILKSPNTTSERKSIKKCQKYCRIIGCNFSRGFVEFIKDKI
jgi:MoaA/NifB/PqqE/SkfB family radical SAM enzyme